MSGSSDNQPEDRGINLKSDGAVIAASSAGRIKITLTGGSHFLATPAHKIRAFFKGNDPQSAIRVERQSAPRNLGEENVNGLWCSPSRITKLQEFMKKIGISVSLYFKPKQS